MTTTKPEVSKNSAKANEVLNGILNQFKTGNVPDLVSIAMFPTPDSPSQRWSLLNRMAMLSGGTTDARTFKQWLAVDRKVKKGAKAIHILAPKTFKVEKETDDGDKEERTVLCGFRVLPVFKVEDTEGEPLPGVEIDEQELPLIERAREWGLDVIAVPGNEFYRGYFSPHEKRIALATPNEKTFFHELAHAAHEKVVGSLEGGQNPLQEIVAELAAAALCRMVGKSADDTTGNSYRYIERYAAEMKMDAHKACCKVLKDTEQVLNIVLHGEQADED